MSRNSGHNKYHEDLKTEIPSVRVKSEWNIGEFTLVAFTRDKTFTDSVKHTATYRDIQIWSV